MQQSLSFLNDRNLQCLNANGKEDANSSNFRVGRGLRFVLPQLSNLTRAILMKS
jgi:hypothetical protein